MVNNKKKSYLLTLTLLFLFSSSARSFSLDDVNTTISNRKIVAGIVLALISVPVIKYSYNAVQAYMDDKISEEIVETISIALKPEFVTTNYSAKEKESYLRKKAKIAAMYTRVLHRLQFQALKNSISQNHKNNLKKFLTRANRLFKVHQTLQGVNEYEKEYLKPSYLDSIIEDYIVASCMLTTKPDIECNQEELQQKQKGAERQRIVMKKLKDKISGKFISMIESIL